jgi:hypothetical protein
MGLIISDAPGDRVICAVNHNSRFHLASVLKLIIMLYALSEVDDTRLSLGELVSRFDLDDIPGSFTADFSREHHPEFSVEELLAAMVQYNDSVIADYFIRRLGSQSITSFCENLGMRDTSINTSIVGLNARILGVMRPDKTLPDSWPEFIALAQRCAPSDASRPENVELTAYNYSTPMDLSILLGSLLANGILRPESTRFARSILERQVSTERMPRLLTPLQRSKVGHSIGHAAMGSNYLCINDVGYYSEGLSGPHLILAFMADQIESFTATNDFIAELSRSAVDLVSEQVAERR